MAKKKKSKSTKIGALGPTSYWLDLSLSRRAELKDYINGAFKGHTRPDGVSVPSVRRIYTGLNAKDGYDLRHIERWSKSRIDNARKYIQSLNTLTSRPFDVLIPRSKKQRKVAQLFTGQSLKKQKSFIVQIQIQNRDKAVFRNGKVAIERKFPSGSKQIEQRFLFVDYAKNIDEKEPSTFRQMKGITKRMLKDMPKNVYGQPAHYTLLSRQYGPIGSSATHGRVMELLANYFNNYDPGGILYEGHKDFAEQVIGWQMIGTFAQLSQYEKEQRIRFEERKRSKKLVFHQRKRR